MTIEEKRRELFEAWARSKGLDLEYVHSPVKERCFYWELTTETAWAAFNAALDAVVINFDIRENRSWGHGLYQAAIDDCRAAIQSTGLGLQVAP